MFAHQCRRSFIILHCDPKWSVHKNKEERKPWIFCDQEFELIITISSLLFLSKSIIWQMNPWLHLTVSVYWPKLGPSEVEVLTAGLLIKQTLQPPKLDSNFTSKLDLIRCHDDSTVRRCRRVKPRVTSPLRVCFTFVWTEVTTHRWFLCRGCPPWWGLCRWDTGQLSLTTFACRTNRTRGGWHKWPAAWPARRDTRQDEWLKKGTLTPGSTVWLSNGS